MNYRNLLAVLVLFVSGTVLFTSCNNDPEPVYEAGFDAFTKKIKVDGETKYALVLGAFGTEPIQSVQVTPPTGDAIQLEKLDNSGLYFNNNIEDTDYKAEMPEIGSYNFSAIFVEGVTASNSDNFAGDEIDFPTIVKSEWNEEVIGISVEWETVEGADRYFVELYNEAGDLIYSSPFGDEESAKIDIINNGYGWYENPAANTTLTVKVNAVLLDGSATDLNWNMSFECVSTTTSEAIWNPAS